MNPESVSALNGLGSVYICLSDYASALDKHKAALALDEECPETHYGLAAVYAYLGYKAKARTHLEQFKQLAPDSRYIGRLESLVEGSTPQISAPVDSGEDTGLDR